MPVKNITKASPEAKITSIDMKGLVTIGFTRKMAVPDRAEDVENATFVLNGTTYPALSVVVVPGKYSDEHKLIFNWTFVSYSSTQMQIQLLFDTPLYVSKETLYPDKLQIIVYGFSLFMDVGGRFIEPGFELKARTLPI